MNVPGKLKSPRVFFWLGMLCIIAFVLSLMECLPLSRPHGFSDKDWFIHQVETSNTWIALHVFAFVAMASFATSVVLCLWLSHEKVSKR
jgi:hypothetical protein